MKKRCFLGFLSILFSAFLSLNAFAADCKANHYTNANGVCTACPAHSHSNGGDTPTCTCDDGFTITGLTDGDTETSNNACVTISDFVIKTTSIPENAVFLFELPDGEYTIDWGDGTVEKQTSTKTFSHTYAVAKEYTIGISGMGKSYSINSYNMDFCGYNNKNVTAGQYIKELGGDLSKMFTRRSSLYENAFNGCKALTTISGPLFGSVNGSSYTVDEFNSTFKDCTSLTTIPGNLFGQITINGSRIFSSTFAGCTSLKEIPSELFANIQTKPEEIHSGMWGAEVYYSADNAFISTFEGSGITSIPSDLFSSITNVSTGMFQNTFKNCKSLSQLPSDLFTKITTPAENLFISTFEGSGITSIPSDLFSSFTSVSTGMFKNTFKNCKSLRQLPNGLFKNISGEPAGSSFYATFNGANLVGFVPADMFEKLDSTNYKSGAMSYIFQNTGLDNVCPGGMYQYKTGFETDWSGKVSCKSCPDNGESIQWENSSATLCFKSENFEDMTGRGIIKNYYNETTNSYEPGVREYTQCNANYYLNNASCTACPAHSHSNGGDTPTCICDDGYTVSGLFNDSTETTEGCREISEIGVVWAPVWPLQGSPAFKRCIIGETCTLPTEESVSHWHDETVVLKYWQNADDPTKTYAPGQQIDEIIIKTDSSPDGWLRLAPVYGCAAGYYGDGTTCTPCPANSHSEIGATVCTCDDGYSADGLTVDNTVAPESGCVRVKIFCANYWPSVSGPSGPPPVDQCGLLYGQNYTLFTADDISSYIPDGYVFSHWAGRNDATITFAPGQEVQMSGSLDLRAVYTCAAGYYGDGTTCTPCPANSHSNGRDTPTCTCDDGYSLNGDVTDPLDQETTTTDCQIRRYGVAYWINRSGSPDRDIRVPHNETFVLLTAKEAKTISENKGTWPGEGYIIEKWRDRNSEVLFLPGALVDKNDVPTGNNWLELVAVFGCEAGYYGDGTTCTVCPEHSTSDIGATVCTCDAGYRMVDNVCEPCPNGLCVNPAPMPPTCRDGYHVDESTNTCVGNTLNIVFQDGDSYNYDDTDLPTGLRVTHGEPVPVLSDLATIGPDMRYQEVVDAGTAEMGIKNWAFDGVTAWLADGRVDTYSMGENPMVSTNLFPAEGDLTVYPVWKTIALKCNAGYYNTGRKDIGKGNCTPCPTTDNQICPGMTEFKSTSEKSGIETCGANSSPNDTHTKCVCNKDYYGDGTTCTACPAHSHSDVGATVCTCDDGYRMADNVCEPCPNGVCVDPVPVPPTCNAGYHVDESTNTCVGNTLNIKFENGGSYNYEVSDLPTGLSVTHGKPVPVLSGLDTIGPDMRYQEVVAAGTAEMGVKNWAFDGVPAWLADGSVDTYSMGPDPIVSTTLFPESGDLTVYPEWKTIELKCNAGYYNTGRKDIGKGNCTPCPTTGNQICPGMIEFKSTSEKSGIETCGANSSPNDAHTECVCNTGYVKDATGTCIEKTYTIKYDDDNTVGSFNHFGSYTIKVPDARDGYVFEYWVDNNGAQYTAGQTISGSDLTETDITLTGVWHCAAGYYGNGTTCTACPAYSHSDVGATVCTCDDGYSLNGYVTDPSDQETTTTDCQIRRYGVAYWINRSGPPDRDILTPHNETFVLLTAEEGKTISENKGTWPGEGYIIEKWRDRNSEVLFLPGAQVDKNDVPTGHIWLELVAVFGCEAGYYGDRGRCTICPKDSYCPGDGQSYACPNGYTSGAGATEKSKCYLTTIAGNWVDSAGAQQTPCPKGSYCPGGVPVYYGDTGGKTSCPANYPYSDAGSDEEDDCYKKCGDTKVENGTAHPEAPTAHHPTDCTYSMGTSTLKNPCNIITKNNGDRFCYESNCPFNQEMLIPGVCTECKVEYADTYDENAPGNCIVKTCKEGYEPYMNSCLKPKMECNAEHAKTAHRYWDKKYLAYGPCLVEECEENYHKDANACESDISPCDIKNGVGEREWQGSNWSACYVKHCERGFTENADGTQCKRCENYFNPETREPAVSNYIDGCEIATCMYQGEKYILEIEKNECSLICDDKTDTTGSRRWNERTKKCEHTCEDGYLPWPKSMTLL